MRLRFRDADSRPIIFDFINKKVLFYSGEFQREPRYVIPFSDIELGVGLEKQLEEDSFIRRWTVKLVVKFFLEKCADEIDKEAVRRPPLDWSTRYKALRTDVAGIYQIKFSFSKAKINQFADELAAKVGCRVQQMDPFVTDSQYRKMIRNRWIIFFVTLTLGIIAWILFKE